jgi:hypothetical protein
MPEQRSRSTRIANAVNIGLFVAACVAFGFGIHALGNRKDLHALYYLLLGGLALKASVDMLRPRSAR